MGNAGGTIVDAVTDSGVAAVEVALMLPFLAMVIVGLIQFGYVFDTQQELQHSARVGVRAYVLDGDATEGETAAKDAARRLDTSAMSVSTTACNPGSPASLTVSIPYDLNIPFVGSDTLSLSATATMQCTGAP